MSVFDEVVKQFGYDQKDAIIQEKMVNKKDLNDSEIIHSKGVRFAFYSLACEIQARASSAEDEEAAGRVGRASDGWAADRARYPPQPAGD